MMGAMGHSVAVQKHREPVEISKDWNGIDQVDLCNSKGASARVSLYGARVTSWRSEGQELIFTSSKAFFKAADDILRGGISICFPEFGNGESSELHGFVKNRMWAIDESPPPLPPKETNEKSFVDLLLKSSEDDLKIWPHRFEFRLRVSLTTDNDLILISRVRNVSEQPFSFSFAFHTYLYVSDISEIRIEGLETLDYLDNLSKRERFLDQGNALTLEAEMDRVYLRTPNVVAVLDHQKRRTVLIRKEGLSDIAVWNPWDKKSKSFPNFGDEEYRQMLCVDGAIAGKLATLKPGQEWTGRLQLSLELSSLRPS